jgi:hypothetical protein
MPANPSSPESPEESSVEPEHMSRAERRAAARGRTPKADPPGWNSGKVAGAHGPKATRRQYSNRRSGG